MSIFGIGQGLLKPVRVDANDPDAAQIGAVPRSRPVTSGAAQLATQQQGSDSRAHRSTAQSQAPSGAQPLNQSGRGQIINLIA